MPYAARIGPWLVGLLGVAAAAQAAEFHVHPAGGADGDGSLARPWDLATALAQPAAVHPGDTLWLHGGTYAGSFVGRLRGAPGERVVMRSAPGEWARIDGAGSPETTLELQGEWADYRDFEVTHTGPERRDDRPGGIDVLGPNLRLINLVLHDLGNNGFWTPAVDSEIYGCLVYHNGYDAADRGHGHGIYSQNQSGTKRIADNILFGGYSFGIHVYTEGGAIQGYDLVGNIAFNAGVVSSVSGHKDDILVGGLQPADRILLRENLLWAIGGDTRSVQLGYGVANGEVRLEDNYIIGALAFSQPWSSVRMTGNTLCTVTGVDPGDHPDNTYLTSDPPEVRVFVRPNQHEPGRAHVAVYNWTRAQAVEVDLSGVLAPGDSFEVRNAQAFFAAPVAGGVFSGAPVSLPQTGLEPAQPIGTPGSYDPADQTGALFNVFVVRRTAAACPDCEPDGADADGAGPDAGQDDGGADGAGADAAPGPDGEDVTGPDGGDGEGSAGEPQAGCGCGAGGEAGAWPLLAGLALALAWRGLRRR